MSMKVLVEAVRRGTRSPRRDTMNVESSPPVNGGGADDMRPKRPVDMVVYSVDTLTGNEINQMIPRTWNEQPPLLGQFDRRGDFVPETERLLKGMLRGGIPPALRCAVQLSNVMQAVHPHQDASYWHEYRTLAKVKALDNAYDSLLLQVIRSNEGSQDEEDPDPNARPMSDHYAPFWTEMEVPTYGRDADNEIAKIHPGTATGSLAAKRVLIALEQILGLADYAPMLPAIATILLTSMSESYTFATIREMGHAASWYFPTSRTEHAAWCCAFGDILRKLHEHTAEYLEDRGVLDVDGLSPIFQDFFLDLLPLQHVQRIMDIYTLEGSKVLFRFGVALLVMYKVESAEQLITISNANEWWHTLKHWAFSSRFDFELLVRKAYGVHGRGLRRQMRFPSRAILERMIRMEEERIRADEELNEDGNYQEPPSRPLGLVCKKPLATEEEEKPVLAHSVQARQHLAQWLPMTLKLTNLDLLYSTNYHGRTMERFYAHVQNAKHTILLCEVLQLSADGLSSETCTIGMYASQAWRSSTKVYGDGGCFLFRLQPDANCWKWHPRRPGQGRLLDHVDLENDENNKTALLEQFMVGTPTYISMGGNPDGSSGLRLNEDLTKGESSPAVGFDNEPLHGIGRGSVFEIGLVEVYGLTRQMDGRAA
jgi:TBC1 domain family member 24